MELTRQQLAAFNERGYLFFPSLFTPAEMTPVRAATEHLLQHHDGPDVYREDNGSTPRLMYDVTRHATEFDAMLRHPRLLRPAEQLLGERAYLYQSRLNPKFGFTGGAWPWHQDFGAWAREDGMPAPRCIMVAVFLDDVTAANGPLLVVPGSQHHGLINADLTEGNVGDFVVMEIDAATLETLANEGGIDALTGPAGSVAFVQCNVVHASAPNLTPWRRALQYFMYNAVSNTPKKFVRPRHLCSDDFTPLSPWNGDLAAVG
ncbi:MAG: phytanoyl-CoA dioxygenase family protein [Candidatus Velthaea sp.]